MKAVSEAPTTNQRKVPLQTRRVMFGVTAAVTARAFLVGQLAYFKERGWEVHLVTGERGLEDFAKAEGAVLHTVPMQRAPHWRDLRALAATARLLRWVQPDLVVMGTPKMGLLGMLAARLVRVPARVYLVHGYRADGASGWGHRILRTLETVAARSATEVVAVSGSLASRLEQERVVRPGRARVLGSGSANGVDLERFVVTSAERRCEAREALRLPSDVHAVAVVGRLTRDKGLTELPHVWQRVADHDPDAWLVVAGEPEPADATDEAALAALQSLPRVRFLGFVADVETVYAAADVLMLTSRREGLGMVALEAAACGVPTVAWSATGVVDAVSDGVTGILVPVGDVARTADAVGELLADDDVRSRLGRAGAERVRRSFDKQRVWEAWGRFATSLVPAQATERKS